MPSLQVQKNILPYPSECVMLSGGGENKVRLRLGERESSESTKKECYAKKVFRDPGFMTGTRDFKATWGQDSRSKVCTGSGCRKYSTVSDKKKIQLWGDIKDFGNFPTEVKKILRKKAQWPLLLVQHEQFSKLKCSYILNDRFFLFSAKTYLILWTRCLLLSMVCN